MAHCFYEWHVLYRGGLQRATTFRVHEDLLQESLGSLVLPLHLTQHVFDVAHYEREHAIQRVGVAQFLDCDDAYSSGLLSGIPIAKLPFKGHHTLVVGICEGLFVDLTNNDKSFDRFTPTHKPAQVFGRYVDTKCL